MSRVETKTVVDIILKIAVLGLMIGWCFQILAPFINPFLWGIILAVALDPIYQWINKRVKGRVKLTSFILTFILVVLILVPSYFLFKSAAHGLLEIRDLYNSGEISVSEPPESVADWPVIGDRVYDLWVSASSNIEAFVVTYQDQILTVGRAIFKAIAGTGADVLQFVLALIIAGVLLAAKGTRESTERIFQRLAGQTGLEFAQISEKTIQNVVKGVLGVAVIQALLVGIGMMLAGVPYAGVWTIIVLILAIMQLPVTIVTIPVIIYLFGDMSAFGAILWTIYFMLAGLSDNVLKPILLGKGAAVPMLVIFLGSIGGFIAFGFIGLFVGAIVLSLMYKLFITWMNETPDSKEVYSK